MQPKVVGCCWLLSDSVKDRVLQENPTKYREEGYDGGQIAGSSGTEAAILNNS